MCRLRCEIRDSQVHENSAYRIVLGETETFLNNMTSSALKFGVVQGYENLHADLGQHAIAGIACILCVSV